MNPVPLQEATVHGVSAVVVSRDFLGMHAAFCVGATV